MKRKLIAFLTVLALAVTLVACGGGEETTVTGMVVAVEGTVISLVEMDMDNMDFAGGERPEMPEGMEGFEGFDPGSFDGTMPEGGEFPRWGEGEIPQWESGEMPQMPDGMTPPEGMERPEDGQMPSFGGEGGMRPGFGNFGEDTETRDIDIADAHISLEIDGGKATGSMADIVPGAFVTVTVSGKGIATYVLVSSQSPFGGSRPF